MQKRGLKRNNSEDFTVESIDINIKDLKIHGTNPKKIFVEIPFLEVKFERFLFFNELKALRGLDYIL